MDQDDIQRRLDKVAGYGAGHPLRRMTPIQPMVKRAQTSDPLPADLRDWDSQTIKRLRFAEHLLQTGAIKS